MWLDPVFDRNETDIFNQTPKAFLDDAALNRLEINSMHLARILGVEIVQKLWGIEDFPDTESLSRILENIQALKDKSTVSVTTPQVPGLPFSTWQAWNDAERILFDIYAEVGNGER